MYTLHAEPKMVYVETIYMQIIQCIHMYQNIHNLEYNVSYINIYSARLWPVEGTVWPYSETGQYGNIQSKYRLYILNCHFIVAC